MACAASAEFWKAMPIGEKSAGGAAASTIHAHHSVTWQKIRMDNDSTVQVGLDAPRGWFIGMYLVGWVRSGILSQVWAKNPPL